MKCNKMEDIGSQFWKETTKPLPGRLSLKTKTRQVLKPSYQEFQLSVDDAWTIQEDDHLKVQSQRTLQTSELSIVHCDSWSTVDSSTGQTDKPYLSEEKLEDESCSLEKLPIGQEITDRVGLTEETNVESLTFKVCKFRALLKCSLIDVNELRDLSWSGVPAELRSVVWKLLSGYLPASIDRRQTSVNRKRCEYSNFVKQYFDSARDEGQNETFRQIHIDIPRMCPLSDIFRHKVVQEMFERILFTWAVRHPASGYVQGMNDLVTPFFIVFLEEQVGLPPGNLAQTAKVDLLPKHHLDIVEADSFWCFSKFLDGLQDNYIFAQIGIQRKINHLKNLIERVDNELYRHLEKHEVDFVQFSFRWINNLMTREIPLDCCIRLWDTYLAELSSLPSFVLYVSAAFLLRWRHQLLCQADYPGLITLLQNLPTHKWTHLDIQLLLAEAHRLNFLFADSPNHLHSISN